MSRLSRAVPFLVASLALGGCPARKDLCPPGDYETVCPPRDARSEVSRRACIHDCREDDDLAILRSQLRGEEAGRMEAACIGACMARHGSARSPALLAECDRHFDYVCGLHRWGRAGDRTVSERIRASAGSGNAR